MRKIIALTTALFLAFVTPSFASVGIQIDDVNQGAITDLNFLGSVVTKDGSVLDFNLVMAGVANGGATSMTTTDTVVSTSFALVKKAIGIQVGLAGTLANGNEGQILTILITERSGSGTFILTPTTTNSFDSITFDAAGEVATLLYVDDTVGWIILNTSATINTPK